MIREREQLQNKLSDLENNKAYLRKAEENIQNQLVYLIANDQIADAENSSTSSPLNQIIQNFINEDRTTVENFKQETINQAIQTIAGQKEIDEILLRQRIERELRYEFNQMQLDHEQKMKIVYRRMIESMYSDLLNS
jgi:viroplasmin and RNaseH domain-containing protein